MTLAMLAVGTLMIILSTFLPKKIINNQSKNNVEQVAKPVVDSLQQVKKDTINFLK